MSSESSCLFPNSRGSYLPLMWLHSVTEKVTSEKDQYLLELRVVVWYSRDPYSLLKTLRFIDIDTVFRNMVPWYLQGIKVKAEKNPKEKAWMDTRSPVLTSDRSCLYLIWWFHKVQLTRIVVRQLISAVCSVTALSFDSLLLHREKYREITFWIHLWHTFIH